jgi:hypothetical protein
VRERSGVSLPCLRPLALATSLALGLSVAGVAQDAPATARAVLRGTVQDLSGAPLEGAEVEVLGFGRKATTPATGAYRVSVPGGRSWVIVRRIGFEPLRVALTFEPGQDRQVIFQLDRRPQRLADVEVRADKLWERRYEDFVWRSRLAWGRFLTRDDIAEARPAVLSDVVRRYLPYVSSQAFDLGPLGGFGMSHASSDARSVCAPLVSLNGAFPIGAWAVNDFNPDDVEALEVYRDRHVPMELQRNVGTSCGVVVIWLK